MTLKAKKNSICFLSDIRKGSSFSLLGVKVRLRYIHGENTQWEQAEISSLLFVLFLRLGLECYVYPVKCL